MEQVGFFIAPSKSPVNLLTTTIVFIAPLRTTITVKMCEKRVGRKIVLESLTILLESRRISRQPTGKSVLIGDRAANFRRHRSFSVSTPPPSPPPPPLSYFLNEPKSEWPLSLSPSLRTIPQRLACFSSLHASGNRRNTVN